VLSEHVVTVELPYYKWSWNVLGEWKNKQIK